MRMHFRTENDNKSATYVVFTPENHPWEVNIIRGLYGRDLGLSLAVSPLRTQL